MSASVHAGDESEFASPLLPATPALAVTPYVYSRARSILMVAIASLTLFLNNGFMLIGISVFDPIMLKRLGVSVGTLKAGDTITFLTVAATAPLAGYLIDTLGPRPLFAIGITLMAAGLFFYTIAKSIVLVYLIYALFGVCLVLCGAFACLIVVSDATKRRRGLGIGILLAASSLGSSISPAIFTTLGRHFGWQASLDIIAVVTLLTLPLIILFVPARLRTVAQPTLANTTGPTLGSSLRARNFWLLGFVAAVGYFGSIGGSTNMVLYLSRDLHLGSSQVNLSMLVLFLCILVSQLVSGLICDIVNRRVLHVICIVTFAAGFALFGTEWKSTVWVAIVLYGLGWGCNYVLLQYLLTHLFSGPSVGRIIGIIGMVEALGGSLGPVAVGASYDHAGSYGSAFLWISVALFVTAIAASQIRSPVTQHD